MYGFEVQGLELKLRGLLLRVRKVQVCSAFYLSDPTHMPDSFDPKP